MIFKEGLATVAFAGEVVLTAFMAQIVTRAVITAVEATIAILRIVLSLQEAVYSYWFPPELRQRATQHRATLWGDHSGKGIVALCSRAQARTLGVESWPIPSSVAACGVPNGRGPLPVRSILR
jgi:hypothetical protein